MTSILNKKIPTIGGLFLLAIAVLTTSYLVNTGVIFLGGAAPSENPQDVRITNVSDTSFTVTYKTDAKVAGTISLGADKTSAQTILDERDQQSGVPKLYKLHSISVKNAKPTTAYSFSITSGTTTYQNNGSLFSVTTSKTLTGSPSATIPLSGKLIGSDGNIPEEAMVFVTTTSGQSLSSLVHQNGLYLVPLNNMLSKDFSSRLTLNDSSVLQVLATDGSQQSQVQVLLQGANPVPLITLGSNYNFVVNTTPIASTAASLGFPPFPLANSLNATPIITVPKKDQTFNDSQPQFSGSAQPNQPVTIEIHSDSVITATTQTDKYGNWTYRPTVPLSPGQHTLIISTKDASGILRTIQQSFTVYASGTQQNQPISPSPTPIPSPNASTTPTVTSTPTPTKSPLVTTTVSPTIGATPTISPTPTSVAKITSVLTPKPTLPPTGSSTLVTTSVLGIVTACIGVVLFVLTKGAAL